MLDRYLFETPRYGLALAALLEAVLLVAYLLHLRHVKAQLLLLGPVIACIALLADGLVQTDREQLQSVTRRIVQAVEDENAGLVVASLSDKLSLDNGFDKSRAALVIRRYLSQPLVASNKINELRVLEAAQDHGTVEFTVSTVIDPQSRYALVRLLRTSWRLNYVRDPDGAYRVSNIRMLSRTGGRPFDIFTMRSIMP